MRERKKERKKVENEGVGGTNWRKKGREVELEKKSGGGEEKRKGGVGGYVGGGEKKERKMKKREGNGNRGREWKKN